MPTTIAASDLSPSPELVVQTLRDVKPLDAQFGKAMKLSVPHELRQTVFGEVGGGRHAHTYALLDAARIPNLPETLAQSGLRNECLYKGKAAENLGHVAPWLVRLDENSSFTRRLFTRGDASWHLWDAKVGIIIRSGWELGALWRNLRKFTRVTDHEGRWYYLRFYDPTFLPKFICSMSPAKRAKFTAGIDRLIAIADGQVSILTVVASDQSSSPNSGFGKGK